MAAIEWDLLRGAVVTLLLVVVAATASGFVTRAHLERTAHAYQVERDRRDQLSLQYRAAQQARSIYTRYAERFEKLSRIGVIGIEPRLAWLEALAAINRKLELPLLRYEIEPQQRLDTAALTGNQVALYSSAMKLEAALLHEGDLVTLLSELRELTGGRFELTSCRLTMAAPGRAVLDASAPNLSAVCRIHWYTVTASGAS